MYAQVCVQINTINEEQLILLNGYNALLLVMVGLTTCVLSIQWQIRRNAEYKSNAIPYNLVTPHNTSELHRLRTPTPCFATAAQMINPCHTEEQFIFVPRNADVTPRDCDNDFDLDN